MVTCAPAFAKDQVHYGEDMFVAPKHPFVVNDALQKVIGKGKLRRIVNKTPQEIEAELPSLLTIPVGERLANITNEQWQSVLNRIDNLEKS